MTNNSFQNVVWVDPKNLYFGQQHAFSADYFRSTHRANWHRVPIAESPHVSFLNGETLAYGNYLRSSWRFFFGSNPPATQQLIEYHDKIRNLYNSVQIDGIIREPIDLYETKDGLLCISDGNHRASVANVLGLKLPARIISAQERALNITYVPNEIYGSQHRSMPYQTIYHGENAIVAGRRDDLLARLHFIKNAISLSGKSLLDLGANFGMSSYLAICLAGVREAHVVEGSKDILSAAVRLAVLLDSPNMHFYPFNLREPTASLLPVCDIAFCFSITAHVGDIKQLVEVMRANVREALVYESHEGRDIEPEIRAVFATCERIGMLGTRSLFLLKKQSRP
jgi:hypothetical protein